MALTRVTGDVCHLQGERPDANKCHIRTWGRTRVRPSRSLHRSALLTSRVCEIAAVYQNALIGVRSFGEERLLRLEVVAPLRSLMK